MTWTVIFHPEFDDEFQQLSEAVQDAFFGSARLLESFGPQLGRPHVDTLNGSEFPNRKELRIRTADGVWRVAFPFDPHREAILLVAGNKSGMSKARFYKNLIAKADLRFANYLSAKKKKGTH